MQPIATGLSLAALYDEQEAESPPEPSSSSTRPQWSLPDNYDRMTPSDLKWELMLGRVSAVSLNNKTLAALTAKRLAHVIVME